MILIMIMAICSKETEGAGDEELRDHGDVVS